MRIKSLQTFFRYVLHLIFIFPFLTHAQINEATLYRDNVVTPSPDAMSLAKFAAMPVTLYNGTVNVSVPLASLPSYGMNLPISINYHTGGIKVNEISSVVGLGWNLQAGGVITRVVRQKPDDITNGYSGVDFKDVGSGKQVAEIATKKDSKTIAGAQENFLSSTYDGEPDIFYFNILGRTGRFVLDANGYPVLTPYQDIKINLILPKWGLSSGFSPAKWVITTSEGTQYIFDHSIQNAETIKQTTKIQDVTACSDISEEKYFPSSWYLSQIISPQGNILYTFQYEIGQGTSYVTKFINQYTVVYSEGSDKWMPIKCKPSSKPYTFTNEIQVINPFYIKQITSPQGKILFTYEVDKQELRKDLLGGKKLAKVEVYANNNQLLKKVELIHGYFGKYHLRLKLDRLIHTDQPPHQFLYNESKSLPSYNSMAIDHWGYANGSDNTTGIPSFSYGKIKQPGDSRSPNEENTKAFVLTKIIYPTGGYTSFEFEQNKYLRKGQTNYNVSWGGLRIKKMITSDSTQTLVKEYDYTIDLDNTKMSSGTTTSLYPPVYHRPMSLMRKSAYWYIKDRFIRYLVGSSHPVNSLELMNGNHLIYKQVSVTENGLGKTVYNFTNFEDHPDIPAEKYEVSSQLYISKKPYVSPTSRAWERGLLIEEKTYDNTNKLRSFKKYDYNFTPIGVVLSKPIYGILYERESGKFYNDVDDQKMLKTVHIGIYKEEQKWFNLSKVTERLYDLESNSYFENTTDYTYNPKNLQIASTMQIASDGKEISTRFKYPVDYFKEAPLKEMPYTSPIQEMYARNMLAYPIETQTWQKIGGVSKLLSTKIQDYTFAPRAQYPLMLFTGNIDPFLMGTYLKNTMILPKKAYSYSLEQPLQNYQESYVDAQGKLIFNPAFELEGTVSRYDSLGRPLEVLDKQQVPMAHVWTKDNRLLAKASYAQYSQVAYTSFEANNEQSRWQWDWFKAGNFNGVKTGSKNYIGIITTKGSNEPIPTGKYIISFWAKGKDNVQVANQNVAVDAPDWKLYEVKLTDPANFEIKTNTVRIDELRMYPENALMTSYTYNEASQQTSVTDANNQSTYYEYNQDYQLKLLRDAKGNILKKYNYHYKNFK